MEAGTSVTFYGVRGSTPCHCHSMVRFGGNTACVVVESEGHDPIVCDAGTGLRFFGLTLGGQPFVGTSLITHLHWDHVQGLPFFSPFLDPNSQATIYGPPERDMSFKEALGGFVRPPYFPVRIEDLPGTLAVEDFDIETKTIGGATITSRNVPHTGRTNGYRIEINGVTVAYIPDHQQPEDPQQVHDDVLALADGADLLIHDAQFTEDLLAKRPDWGHCTPAYALNVAEQAGAKRLALFHHDPLHDDDTLEQLCEQTAEASRSVQVVAAAEGLKVSL